MRSVKTRAAAAAAAMAVTACLLSGCGAPGEKCAELISQGAELYKKGDYSGAASILAQAEAEPEKVKEDVLYYYLGESCFKLGDYEKSIEYHKKVIEIAPDMFKSYVTLGVCHRKLGDTESALMYYSKALEYDPMNGDSVGLYVSLGSLYISNGKPFSAIDHLEDAVAIYPEHAAAHAYLAMAYAMAYENEKSRAELELAEALGYPHMDEIRSRINSID